MGSFLERGISFRGNFFLEFGVSGGTYPPQKYPSAPPGISITVQREHTIEKKVLIL